MISMSEEHTSRNKVGADLATSLLADHLGVNLDELKAKREADIAAEEARKHAEREQREREAEARRQEARCARFAEAIASGAIHAWRSDPKKDKMVEIRRVEDLACPVCGEVPALLGSVTQAFDAAIFGFDCDKPWFDTGTLSPTVNVHKVPAFRIKVSCPCGKETIFAAVCMPKE